MDVEYAYCDACGVEYNEHVRLDYIGKTASQTWLRCAECGDELSQFVELGSDDESRLS